LNFTSPLSSSCLRRKRNGED
jgi:hypothetical protein